MGNVHVEIFWPQARFQIIDSYWNVVYEILFTFSRRFYPKRLTVHSGYAYFCEFMCSLGIEPTTFFFEFVSHDSEDSELWYINSEGLYSLLNSFSDINKLPLKWLDVTHNKLPNNDKCDHTLRFDSVLIKCLVIVQMQLK